jgi:menaquinone-specific isochorismate synthase
MQPRSEVPPKGSLSDQISFDDVAELLHVAMERYQETRKPVLVSVTRPLLMDVSPIELFHAAQKLVGSRYYWAKPAQKSWMVSAGDAVQIVTEGPLRFQEASARIRETVSSAVIQPDGGSGPIFMGGFRFSSLMSNEGPWEVFHDGLLTLPKWMILASANGLRRIVTNVVVDAATQVDTLRNELHTEAVALFGSASDSWQSVRLGPIKVESDGGDWGRNVVEALDAIEDGTLTKVTLARTLRLSSQTPIQPEPVLSNLQANYPECHVFAFCRDGLCFVGASPEELVRLQDSTVTSTCLSGSTARVESET